MDADLESGGFSLRSLCVLAVYPETATQFPFVFIRVHSRLMLLILVAASLRYVISVKGCTRSCI
jgi:hypothetical protein